MNIYALHSESFVSPTFGSDDSEDIRTAWKEGNKKGPPRWLAPPPKLPKIVAWKLPYLGGWKPEPNPSHSTCAIPGTWQHNPTRKDR